MSGGFKKGGSNLFVSIFIGFIVISFMFTGYESMKGSPNSVATVGDIPVKVNEYRQEYDRQMEFYKRMLGGNINSQQIEQFGLKKNALNNLIDRNLMIIFSEKIGYVASPSEVRNEIRNLPYFQTNNQFDISKYKFLLSRNGYTPTDFEGDIEKQVKVKTAAGLLGTFPISTKYIQEREKFREKTMEADLVQFNSSALEKMIKVSSSEIKAFVADEKNKSRLQGIFNSRKAGLDQKEEVLASHILLKTTATNEKEVLKKITDLSKKVNTKNFASMAKKHSEGPSNKKGGDLNWFGKGRMVPSFENAAFGAKKSSIVGPIKTKFGYHLIWVRNKKAAKEATLAEHQNTIAEELIKKDKATPEQIKEMTAKFTTELKAHLATNNKKKIDSLKSKYGLKYETKIAINRLDGVKGQVQLKPEDLKTLFTTASNSAETFVFEEGSQVTLLRGKLLATKKEAPKAEVEKQTLSRVLTQKLRQKLIENLKETVAIKVNDRIL